MKKVRKSNKDDNMENRASEKLKRVNSLILKEKIYNN